MCTDCFNRLEQWTTYCERVQLNQDVFLLHSTKPIIKIATSNISHTPASKALNEETGELYVMKLESDPINHLNAANPVREEDFEESHLSSDSDVDLDYDDLSKNFTEKSMTKKKSSKKKPQYPSVLIKDAKLVVRGKQLNVLMSNFYRLECDLCPNESHMSFKDIYSFFNHYKSIHQMKGYVICCATKFFKARAMALHMCRHLDPDSFRCPDCGKLLTCPKILQFHRQNHLPESERPFSCSQCPRRFSYNSALIAHSITHLPEERRNLYPCTECDKVFSTSGRLSTHMNLRHSKNGQEFICHLCAKAFTSKGNLTYHLTTHQPNAHSMQCKICLKWLRNKICLRKHMIQHSEEKFECNLCNNYVTVNKQCLLNHIRVKHKADKPFVCERCKKSFKLKNTLVNHMRQHTSEKPYTCEFCQRKFTSSGNFYSHRKRMHATQVEEQKVRKAQEADNQRKKLLKIT